MFTDNENKLTVKTFHGVEVVFTMQDNADCHYIEVDGVEFEPYTDTLEGVYVLMDIMDADKGTGLITLAQLRNKACTHYEGILREEAQVRSYDKINTDCMI